MVRRFYFVIQYLPNDVDEGLLAGRCISILHGILSTANNGFDGGIGVAFPHWNNQSLGNTIAFVSQNQEHLRQLSLQPYFQIMKREQLFYVSPIESVPDRVREVRFKRNQGVAKCFPGEKRRRIERAKRRAQERGEIFRPELIAAGKEFEHFHRVLMASKSTGQKYLLHIQKEENVVQCCNQYSGYGLATNKELMGSVPDFSQLHLIP